MKNFNMLKAVWAEVISVQYWLLETYSLYNCSLGAVVCMDFCTDCSIKVYLDLEVIQPTRLLAIALDICTFKASDNGCLSKSL